MILFTTTQVVGFVYQYTAQMLPRRVNIVSDWIWIAVSLTGVQ